MKSFLLFFCAVSGTFAAKVDQRKICESVGGRCFPEGGIEESCDLLPTPCGDSSVCCLRSEVKSSVGRKCQCGQGLEARIIGGEEVSPKNKYPWMVGINDVTIEFPYICGGSLINDRYVITAAHCLNKLKAKNLKVGLADHNLMSTEDDVASVTRLVDVEKIIIHEKFVNVPVPTNDIALMKLKVPLDLSAHKEIKPVCLPAKKDATYEGVNATIVGWGVTNVTTLDMPSELLEATVPILEPKCSGLIKHFTDAMLCAGLKEGGKDSCYGDSGGPLVVKESTNYVLVGIVSFGIPGSCAEPLEPGVYTKITYFLDWIKEHTGDAYYCS